MQKKKLYINFHSHQSTFEEDEKVIINISAHFSDVKNDGYFSEGIHPWFIKKETWEMEMLTMKNAVVKENILAVGECGLDKICDTDFTLQQEVFAAQVILANELKKPLIIHCVKAFDEVVNILKQQNNKVPAIFHGFNKNMELAKYLTNKGYFLSFGKSILSEKKGEILRELLIEKIFFETDYSSLKIDEIYKQAAGILNLPLQELQMQIIKNAREVFGDKLLN